MFNLTTWVLICINLYPCLYLSRGDEHLYKESHSDDDMFYSKISRSPSDHQWFDPFQDRNLFTLWTRHVSHHHGWVRFQVSDRKLVNHTTEMILWSIILVWLTLVGVYVVNTTLPIPVLKSQYKYRLNSNGHFYLTLPE